MGQGELAGLLAAAFWATGSLLYGRTRLTALSMNYGKNVIATLVLFIHLAVAARLSSRGMFEANASDWGWLSLSALFGIVAGDTCYFRSLQILGPRRALVVATSSPVFAAVLGWLLLDESISSRCSVGIALTLAGVCVVSGDRRSEHEAPGLFPGSLRNGVLVGIAGALFNALGAVASRHAMATVDAVEAAFIRILVAAVAAMVIVRATKSGVRSANREILKPAVLRWFVPAVLCGTWLGIWLSQIAYKYSPVAVATTLTATSPIFAIPLVFVFLGHRPTSAGVIGTTIAMLGVWLTAS